ncbi:family 78 glycoside hydrolase catalytic domain [Microbacterium trichothecenolyticum]|uniref:alpha-L-rhamnosidase n=1 Tax=Microbacterium ureisolvens TaxID=2781186 RepID=A0ABS7I6W7_9MICO|nr:MULTISPECIES: alpha-L-rhamnosidase [Microbacterium]MBW9111974.1 family 78 glycoside hydrolase catalytic domain [Microbacterium ureisolvens]MBW9122417.1 family 78 glycoside hydrolase catalytic domain [Microbacterium trichothecenolyticum]
MTLPAFHSVDVATRIVGLRSQHDPRLLGVPGGDVRLRWMVESADATAAQLGFQTRSRRPGADWTVAEPLEGSEAIDLPAADGPLAVRDSREYAVRIATPHGWTEWSDPVRVDAGVPGDALEALVIDVPSRTGGPVPTLRREFELDAVPERGLLRISALGVYDVWLNGIRATDGFLNPGWNAYQRRILLDTVDVTTLLQAGRNAIAITVADGWYRGRMGFAGRTEIYGDRIGVIAQLEADGTVVVATDESWRGGFGPILAAGIYDGSTVDFTLDNGDPSIAGFHDADWMPVRTVPTDKAVFQPRAVAPVRAIAEFPMQTSVRGGATALDARQNIAGWVRLTVEGRRGDTVTVRHAEVLEPDGALHTAALRTAKATDTYVLGYDGVTVLEPPFTFHGFRYAEVTGTAKVVEATAIAISTDLPARASFASSHETLNRFHENVRWSQLDNFVSLPTDCPQRDERLGWTGDAQAFAATASTLFDTETFWESWLQDLEIEQTDEGGVPSIVPNIIFEGDMQMGVENTDTMGRAGWADAATIVPLAVFQSYGSRHVLAAQLSSMRRWVEHLRRRAGEDVLLPEEPFQYGDWLDPDAPADRPWEAKVDSLFVANSFYVQSARLLARAECELGDAAAGEATLRLAESVAAAVWQRWGAEAGRTQTGAAMCLVFDIVPDAERATLAAQLAAAVRAERGRIATGFLGTPLVLDALSANGHLAEAYLMLLRRDAPSWLYQVDRGATTVWERWDAIKEDGSIHRGEMATHDDDSMISFNHYAYGAVIDWVYRNVAGLAPAEPGYRVVRVAPRPAEQLRSARATIATGFGPLSSEWTLDDDDTLRLMLRVPFGSEARLDLPTTDASIVTVDGAPAPRRLSHGEHRIIVSAASVVEAS